MDASSKNTLFSFEQKVVEEAEAALARAGSQDAPLRREFERLLDQYKKMFKQSERLIRLSDSQQQKLNDALEQLENAKEMADSANRFKSMFLANMSHEIRTPMNAIIGLTSLALKAEVSPKVREYLNTVQISAHSLLGIINDILDFSKIEAGKLDLESVPFHLESVTGYIADLFSERAANSGVKLLFHIDEDVPRQLVGDPLRLGQILVNLTGNAMKFTRRGKIEIFAKVLEIDSKQTTIRFQVSDTGIGIAEDQLPHLFDSFTQADGSTTRNYGGTGLGLTICKLLAEMMGGDMKVRSKLGEGSSFYFALPFLLDASSGAAYERKSKDVFKKEIANKGSLRIGGLRVLLVEDNAINREVAQEILGNARLVTETARNGRHALEILRRTLSGETDPFDIVLMDVQMPEMDGYEATGKIRSELRMEDLPVIAMTAHAMKGDREKCIEAGMNDYIAKPIDPDQLVSVISEWGPARRQGRVDARELSRFEADVAPAFPDSLPGLDLKSFMNRLDGNKKLLSKVMKQFIDNYSTVDLNIKKALDAGDYETAKRMSHTLKGVAATFSAYELNDRARELEVAIGEEDGDWQEKIEDFGVALRVVVKSAHRLVDVA